MTPQQQQAAHEQIRAMINQGFTFEVPSLLMRLRGKRVRKWLIQQPFLGTIAILGKEYNKMGVDPAAVEQQPWEESSRLAAAYGRQCAYVLAIAVLNSASGIFLWGRLLSWYFMWRITPGKLHQLVNSIMIVSNLGDVVATIRLLNGRPRTTQPLDAVTGQGLN